MKKLRAICLVVFLGFLGGLVFLAINNRHRPANFDDSDLVPARGEVPAESNAFWTLAGLTNTLYWPKAQESRLGDLCKNTNWDDALAAEVLEKNRAGLDLFERSFAQPFLVVPEPATFAEDLPYLADWKTLARIETIRANAWFRNHREMEAFALALKIVQFGQRVENSRGLIIHYLTGSAIKAVGLQQMRQLAAQTGGDGTNLVFLLHQLDAYKSNREGLTNALKMEYQQASKYFDGLSRGKYQGTNSGVDRIAVAIGLSPLFSPVKTRMKYAQALRVVRGNLSRPYAAVSWAGWPEAYTNHSMLNHLIRGNVIGDVLFDLLAPADQSLIRAKSREQVNVTATQLVLALRAEQLRHGMLLTSLSSLVPEYFPRVPADDFDGHAFRYLPEKKLLYSVGPALRDLGGASTNGNSRNGNLPFPIEF